MRIASAAWIMLAALNALFAGTASAEPLVIAHRGASGYLPEHTAEAKVAAHIMGADFIEQDVVISKDGVPMVLHDITLDATTDVAARFADRVRADGRYYAIDFTAQEIQSLNVNERRSRRHDGAVFPGRFPLLVGNFRVSSLAQEIELIAGLNRSSGRGAGLYVEIKDPAFHHKEGVDLAKVVLELLASYDLDLPVFVQCFDWSETKRIRRELGYKGQLVQLIGENDWWDLPGTDFDWLRTPAGMAAIGEVAQGIGPHIGQVLDEQGVPTKLTGLAHAAGLVVHPYTLRADRLPDMASDFTDLVGLLLAAGVDGFFTDFPDLVLQAIADTGQ